jgi:hypothetical protein
VCFTLQSEVKAVNKSQIALLRELNWEIASEAKNYGDMMAWFEDQIVMAHPDLALIKTVCAPPDPFDHTQTVVQNATGGHQMWSEMPFSCPDDQKLLRSSIDDEAVAFGPFELRKVGLLQKRSEMFSDGTISDKSQAMLADGTKDKKVIIACRGGELEGATGANGCMWSGCRIRESPEFEGTW